MDNSIKELGKIRDSIISGNVSESRLREMIDKAKKEYGEDVFTSYDLNSVRQYVYSKPYYERLVQLAKNGACSKEFFIHLLRVRDSIKKQNLKWVVIVVFFVFLLCISIFSLGFSILNNAMLKALKNGKLYEMSNVSIKNTQLTEEKSNVLVINKETNNDQEAE